MELRYLRILMAERKLFGKVYKETETVLQYRKDAKASWEDVKTEVEIFE
jgi:uncharacterized protein YcaQ